MEDTYLSQHAKKKKKAFVVHQQQKSMNMDLLCKEEPSETQYVTRAADLLCKEDYP